MAPSAPLDPLLHMYQESKQLHVCPSLNYHWLIFKVAMYQSLLIEQLVVLVLDISGVSLLVNLNRDTRSFRNLGPDITYRKKLTA